MPVDINVSMRCTSKSLSTGMPPVGGGAPVDSVNVLCQILAQGSGTAAGNLNMTFPLSEDQFVVGGYYTVTMVDGSAPADSREEKQENGAFTPPQRVPMPRG